MPGKVTPRFKTVPRGTPTSPFQGPNLPTKPPSVGSSSVPAQQPSYGQPMPQAYTGFQRPQVDGGKE